MSALRDRILQFPDVPKETVKIDEWDGAEVEVRGLTVRARSRLFQDVEGEEVDLEKFYPDLVIYTAYDPETGEQLFGEEDREAISGKSSAAVDRIAQKAIDLSGLAGGPEDEAKNSETPPSNDSSSG